MTQIRLRLCLLLLAARYIQVAGFSPIGIRVARQKWRHPPLISGFSSNYPLVNGLSFNDPHDIRAFHSIVRSSMAATDFANDDKRSRSTKEGEYDKILFAFSFIPPVLAFFFHDDIAKSVAYFFDFFGFRGSNVDGNAFATNLLRPTINGVVVPATAIVLGTLFATTVNVLWNRQLRLRANINKEVGELRLLRRAIFGCFGTAQHSKRRAAALGLLLNYTRTLIVETQIDGMDRLEEIQMNGGISMNELDELADMLHGVDGAAASRQNSVSTAEALLVSLNDHRSERVATTLSVFPELHWFVLAALFVSINVSFLIESNQEVLQYLNSVQVRTCSDPVFIS